MNDKNRPRVVSADMLESLPEPVQRYMTYTGVVGKPWPDTVRVKQTGRFRREANQPWMPVTAEQIYTTNPPAFLWKARFKMAGLWLMNARDMYKAGQGHMFGQVAGLFTVFDVCGDKLTQAAMVRYLSEMMWFPTALLGGNITWQSVDDHSAQITFADCGRAVSARMVFDDAGRPINFVAQRYRGIDDASLLDTWSTPILDYSVHAGLNLPVRGQVVWKLVSGDVSYFDWQVTEVEYNSTIESF